MKARFILPIFLGGFVLGAGVGYIISKHKYEKNEQEVINKYRDDLAKRREMHSKYVEVSKADTGECNNSDCNSDDIDDTSVSARVEMATELAEEIKRKEGYTPEQVYLDENGHVISENEWKKGKMLKEFKARQERKENKYSRKHIDYDPEDELYDDEDEVGPTEHSDEPYEITYDEYAGENSFFDKQTIIYYDDDDVLIYEESDEQILEDGMVLGENWRDWVEDKDTAYIRNEKLTMDIELIVKYCAYEHPDE